MNVAVQAESCRDVTSVLMPGADHMDEGLCTYGRQG